MTAWALRELDADAYAAWFDANRSMLRNRSPFHEPAWLGATARGVGFRLGFIGAYDGDELTAVVPGFLARRGPVQLFGSPLRGTMTSYLGPVSLTPLSEVAQGDLIVEAAGFARRRWHARYVRFTVRDAPKTTMFAPGPDWHQQRPQSYRLDLTPGEDIVFASFKSSCRRNVRKAVREGVEIVPFEDPRGFHRLLQDTFRRHDSSTWHSAGFFESIIGTLAPAGLLRGWGARYGEEIIAAGLFFHDEREIHFLSGASTTGHGNLPTSYLLHWHAIVHGIRDGIQVFNTEASGVRSIDEFKETFNPVREQRGTSMYAPRPVWAAQRAFLKWHKGMQRFRSRVAIG